MLKKWETLPDSKIQNNDYCITNAVAKLKGYRQNIYRMNATM